MIVFIYFLSDSFFVYYRGDFSTSQLNRTWDIASRVFPQESELLLLTYIPVFDLKFLYVFGLGGPGEGEEEECGSKVSPSWKFEDEEEGL